MGSGVVAVLAAVLAVAPPAAISLSPTRITINASAGNQYDPHVDDDVAAYTDLAGQRIHYFRFSTATDAFISPLLEGGAVARDELSDVDRERIVFTRVFPSGTSSIMLFNTATAALTEVAPAPLSIRLGVGLGSQTVAFIDYGITPDFSGELMVFDLATNTLSRLTNDAVVDFNPQVSPDGATIVWERCALMSNCEIARATRAGAGWTISVLTSSLLSDVNPDTNGTVTVFERQNPTGPTGTDLVFTSAGVETVLEMPGEQYNPSIRGNLVAFESRAGGSSDIFLYELDQGRLFQVTSTTGVNETLNDVTLTAEGQVRLVWQADDEGSGNNNIYGATFTLPPIDGGGTGGGAGGGGGGVGSGGGAGGGDASGGGAGGGGDAAGGGGGVACAPQTVTLEASKSYRPTAWVDGEATLTAPHAFALPAELAVTEGNAGNHWVRLEIDTGRFRTFCRYRGGAAKAHPTDADDVAAGARYVFGHCTGEGHGLAPGDVVTATALRLHIDDGDSWLPVTRVGVTLESACPSSGAAAGTDGLGCASAGPSPLPTLLWLGLALLWLSPRPARIRLLAERSRRRLPR